MSNETLGLAWIDACRIWGSEPPSRLEEVSDAALRTALKAFREIFALPPQPEAKPEAKTGAKTKEPPSVPQIPAAAAPAIEQKLDPSSLPKSTQTAEEEPLKRTGPVPMVAPVSIFKIDLQKEKAGDFFSTLRLRRNDPNSDPVLQELMDRQEAAPAPPLTARQLFAYSIPWSERGGTPPDAPAITTEFDRLPVIQSFTQLSELATHQALHTASRMKRQSEFVDSYASRPSGGNSASSFFQTIDWTAPRGPRTTKPA